MFGAHSMASLFIAADSHVIRSTHIQFTPGA